MRLLSENFVERAWKGWELLRPKFLFIPLFFFNIVGLFGYLFNICYNGEVVSLFVMMLGKLCGFLLVNYSLFLGFGGMYSRKVQAVIFKTGVNPDDAYVLMRQLQFAGVIGTFILLIMVLGI
jgi:hypothetical protein